MNCRRRTELVDAPHWTVGDRLAAFAVLLPAEVDGPVVLALSDELAPHLQAAFPGAVVLTDGTRTSGWPDPSRVVRWDGVHPPVAPGSADLVVVDGRRYDVAAVVGARHGGRRRRGHRRQRLAPALPQRGEPGARLARGPGRSTCRPARCRGCVDGSASRSAAAPRCRGCR